MITPIEVALSVLVPGPYLVGGHTVSKSRPGTISTSETPNKGGQPLPSRPPDRGLDLVTTPSTVGHDSDSIAIRKSLTVT